jgi:hypothetical protein
VKEGDMGHEVALWGGVTAFFASLIAVGIFDVFNPDQWIEYVGAIIVAFITGGSIYAKQRLDDAKKAEEANARPATTVSRKKKGE